MVSSITLLSTQHLLLTKKDWKHKVELEDGIKTMFEWYLKEIK
jgi:nucleoside-diphosphate-sugar epimerase